MLSTPLYNMVLHLSGNGPSSSLLLNAFPYSLGSINAGLIKKRQQLLCREFLNAFSRVIDNVVDVLNEPYELFSRRAYIDTLVTFNLGNITVVHDDIVSQKTIFVKQKLKLFTRKFQKLYASRVTRKAIITS